MVEFDVAVLKGRPKETNQFKSDPKAPRLSNQSIGRQSGLMPSIRRNPSIFEGVNLPAEDARDGGYAPGAGAPPRLTINGLGTCRIPSTFGRRGGTQGATQGGTPAAQGSLGPGRRPRGRPPGSKNRGTARGGGSTASTAPPASTPSPATVPIVRVDPATGGVARPSRTRQPSRRLLESAPGSR
ncbi:hypothetical protein QBC37DRAFT_381543 [Rhypophila decipiens]|uniref:Uncharacterized protein n=1 Tax=Rhypophila decipiens TaxID=261697 RepID=A0AAN6XUU1_9PEZI|nr:hypothetical protein QBC37DRAFT_381543 [Rhypophila decipiens]